MATFYMRRRVRELLGIRTTKAHIENMGTASLDVALDDENDTPLVELIADPAALDPEEAVIQADMQRIVREAVAALPAEECAAINNTYLPEGRRGGAISYVSKTAIFVLCGFYGFRLVPLFASCAKTDCMPVTTGNKKAGLFPAALYCRDLFPFLQCIFQFHQPCRAVISHGEKLAILVAGNLNKSVFVVKEGRFIAVFQDAPQRLKTLREPS